VVQGLPDGSSQQQALVVEQTRCRTQKGSSPSLVLQSSSGASSGTTSAYPAQSGSLDLQSPSSVGPLASDGFLKALGLAQGTSGFCVGSHLSLAMGLSYHLLFLKGFARE